MFYHPCFHSAECEGGVKNVMRLDNPLLVPQHRLFGLLFWSAALVINNEWRGQWRHYKPEWVCVRVSGGFVI